MSATNPFVLFHQRVTNAIERTRDVLFRETPESFATETLLHAASALAWRAAWLERHHRPHLAASERDWEEALRIVASAYGAQHGPRSSSVIARIDVLDDDARDGLLELTFVRAVAALDVLSPRMPAMLDARAVADLATKLTDVAAEHSYARDVHRGTQIGSAPREGAR